MYNYKIKTTENRINDTEPAVAILLQLSRTLVASVGSLSLLANIDQVRLDAFLRGATQYLNT